MLTQIAAKTSGLHFLNFKKYMFVFLFSFK